MMGFLRVKPKMQNTHGGTGKSPKSLFKDKSTWIILEQYRQGAGSLGSVQGKGDGW